MHKPIYFDYMATTPIDPRVTKAMLPYLNNNEVFGNSASQHFYGYQAKKAIDDALTKVTSLINCTPKSIIWTSGATESNNLAIKGTVEFYQRQGKHIITCKTEHKSVIDVCEYLETKGFDVTYLKPKPDGLIDLNDLKQAIRPDTILVSIMHVNNEIGVIQDIEAISDITSQQGVLFHVDATQSVGKIPIDLQKLKIDLMSFSAHKIYGPKGIGALYIRQEPRLHLDPQIHGGKHQSGFRSGTLATHQIVGMGEALNIAKLEMEHEYIRQLELQKRLWKGIKILDNIRLNGSLNNRIATNLNISFADIDGEILIAALKDLALSSAAACTKNTHESSHVLTAIGLTNEMARNSIRISFGRFTTEEEIDYAIEHITSVVKQLQKTNP